MFIVWRRRPIHSNRKVELFVAYDPVPLDDRDGSRGKSRRQKREPSLDDPAWKPLYCGHAGPGRIAWTPLLIHAERIAGKPRQRLLYRFATIRNCCIADEFMRAA